MDYLISFVVSDMANIAAYIVAKWIDKQSHDKIKKVAVRQYSGLFGAPDRIRTCGLVSRSHTRYPAAPRAHITKNDDNKRNIC